MIEQGSPEWHQMRLGKLTASRIADALTKSKTTGKPLAGRANLQAALVTERITGNPSETYSNAAMQWGNDTEPQARAAYEFDRDVEVTQVAFVDHDEIAMSGASPDGLVGKWGLIEIKCPQSATHIATLLGTPVDKRYVTQMQWQMACTGRQWVDFISFDPRMPAEMQLFIQRFERDERQIADLEREAEAFLQEVAQTEAELRARYLNTKEAA